MISISVVDTGVLKAINRIKGGLNAATAKAVNATAEIVKNNQSKEMQRAFDRPTNFTLNSMRIIYATATKPTATVTFKDGKSGKYDEPGHYLLPQVYGGQRKQRPGERRLSFSQGNQQYYLVPTRYAPKDSSGNLPRGFMQKVLADLGALTKKQTERKPTKRRKAAKPKEYFAIYDTAPGLKPGIYRRIGSAFGRAVVPIFIFSKTAPSYRPLLRWNEVGQATVERQLPDRLKEEVGRLVAGSGG
jgi:hypothetical protein